jgi:hypothetical protein
VVDGALFTRRIYTTIAATLDYAGPSPQELVWPIAADPSAAGQPSNVPGLLCMAIDGVDLAAFMKAAATARANTVWTARSIRYAVSVRPFYPDESGCTTAAG